MIRFKKILNEIYFDGFTISEENSAFHKPENFDRYAEGKGWTAWRGGNDWENGCTAASVIFEGGPDERARMWFTIKYPEKLSELVGQAISERNPAYESIYKLGKRITNKWIREATRIHRIPRSYSHNGKVIKRDWKECFQMALESKALKPYVKECGVDYTKWHAMRRQNDTPTSVEPEKHDNISEGVFDSVSSYFNNRKIKDLLKKMGFEYDGDNGVYIEIKSGVRVDIETSNDVVFISVPDETGTGPVGMEIINKRKIDQLEAFLKDYITGGYGLEPGSPEFELKKKMRQHSDPNIDGLFREKK